MTYMEVDQKWVMQFLGEEINISTKAGENNCSVFDECEICI